jgi:hypothetical protein
MRDFVITVKRIYFWVLCPLVVVVAAVFWFLGVGAVGSQQKKNRQEIDGLYNTVSSLRQKERHPNSEVAQGMLQLIEKRRQEVAQAWKEKYLQQAGEKSGILTWPNELGEDLIDQVKDLRPIEQKVHHPPDSEMELILSLRRRYQSHIEVELPKLADVIGSKWYLSEDATNGQLPMMQERAGRGDRGPIGVDVTGMRSESAAEQSLVEWSTSSQQEILQQHFQWQDNGSSFPGMDPRASTPGSGELREPNLLEILYAQEDLWVLQAIMNVIRRTNEGATARYNAAIKEIDFIRMGKSAVVSSGRIQRPATMADANVMGGGMENPGISMRSMEGQSSRMNEGQEYPTPDMPMEGEPIAQPAGPDPAEGRYVDRDYAPLPAATLRSAMTQPETVDPSNAYLLVAKRIPIRMRVKIDQTKLDRFLVQCANSELTIEVRQIRVNPKDDGTMDSLYSGMPGQTQEIIPMPGPQRERGRVQPGVLDPTSSIAAIEAQSRTDLTVEIYGIVYFYNPVNENLLGKESAEGMPNDNVAATP